ncbi:MAG: hypothetical protein R3F37_13915 [Candidatus Competibacteraceae bacterium]
MEPGLEHPVAQALSAAAQGALRAEQLRNTPGAGVEAGGGCVIGWAALISTGRPG